MNVNARLAEQVQICSSFVPVNMATAANTGDWVSMAGYQRCSIVLFKGAGTAGDDPVITVQQATTNTGTGAKALNFTDIDEKVGTLTGVAAYTHVTQSAGNTYENTASAESEAIIVIDILAEMLDAANDFDFVQASVADVGTNAQYGGCLYLLWGARYEGADLMSALS